MPGQVADAFSTMNPILRVPLYKGCASKKQASSKYGNFLLRFLAMRNFANKSLIAASLTERSLRSVMFSGCVDVKYFKRSTAIDPYLAVFDPSNGVPRKRLPMVWSAMSFAALSVSWFLESAFATTKPPRLCATKMIGRSVYRNQQY